jgi:hypothetical protein
MKISNARLKKTFIIVISSLIITITVIFLLISPITKYLIDKYDEKYTGREIKTGWVYVNLFRGYVHISNLIIYESKNMTNLKEDGNVFFIAKGLSANFSVFKLLFKTIEITNLTLDNPKGIIIQDNKDFNFIDLIKKFTPEQLDTIQSHFHFNILRIKIKNGELYYHENVIPINYFIKKVNFKSTGKHWNADTIRVKFSLLSGTGSGSVEGNFTINFKNLDYSLAAVVQKFDLKFLEQYIREIVNYGDFSASIDADIKATGNLRDQENLNLKGLLTMNDFHFEKSPDDKYASFDKLVLKIDEMCPKNNQYLFDSLTLNNPFLKYERYDYLDNLQRMFGRNGANISAIKANPLRFNLIIKIAEYVKVLAKNFLMSDYKINKLAIYNGNLKFNDYSLTEKFSIEASPLYVFADSVNKNGKWVEVSLKSEIQPYGDILAVLSINPTDSGDFNMQYHLQGLPASIFNPYLINYTSFPIKRGTVELNGTWKVRNGDIKSDNHLVIIDPHLSNRIVNKDAKWIPSPLLMFFIRERGKVIDYEIPITGNLKDPQFNLSNAVFDIVRNIFVKSATFPYKVQENKTGNEIEKSLALEWNMRQTSLLPDQKFFLNEMADFLLNNPDATIDVHPVQYVEKEKEYILFFEAKKKYFQSFKYNNALFLSEDDSLKVDKMSAKDSLFVNYLSNQVPDTMMFTIQEKCNNLIGSAIIDVRFKQLIKEREDAFMSLFKEKNVESRVKIYSGENNIPYNGFSFYNIIYNGKLPESLIKAYHQMNE